MERRSFLRGMLVSASAAAGTALVRLAEPQEVRALVEHRDVYMAQPHEHPTPNFQVPEVVYVKRDNGFVAVGYCTQFEVQNDVERHWSWNGTAHVYPGMMHELMRFVGPDWQ